jgi:signal recognition particle receptor subunit beta
VMGRLEERGVPFVVAVNSFPDAPRYPVEELRTALDLSPDIPIVECDARRRASSRDTLMTLMRFLHSLAMTGALR